MKQVACVAVQDNQGRILMGRRKDNGRWTLPGGHLEPGDRAIDGAIRELFEESGIKASGLYHLTSKIVRSHKGERICVHAYQCAAEPRDITTDNDPDDEVYGWEWVEAAMGLPKRVASNLHNKEDVVLQHLGLQKSESFVIDTASTSKPGLEPDLYIDDLELSDSKEFVIDLMKAGPHKYLRKYKGRDGKWIYIYHEGDAHGRQIPEEAVNHLKKLAEEHGHEHARNLLGTMQEHAPEKIQSLLTLAQRHGETAAGQAAKKHLTKMGISHEEKLHERILPKSHLGKELDDNSAADARAKIIAAVDSKVYGHLRGYTSSPFQQKISEAGLNQNKLAEALAGKKDIRSMLIATHEHLQKVDQAHSGLGQPQNGSARNAGGYGNYGFQGAVDALKDSDHIHADLATHLKEKRTPEALDARWGKFEEQHKTHREGAAERVRQRAERERAERERREREQRERAEAERRERERQERAAAESWDTHKESVEDMMSYWGKSLTEPQQKQLALGIANFFGDNFKFKRFWDHLQGHPEVEIKVGDGFLNGMMSASRGGSSNFSVQFTFVNNSGQQITYATRSISKNDDGSITWSNGVFNRASNANLARYPGMATGLYGGVENFLREVTSDWSGPAKENTRVKIGTAANSGFGNGYKGALVWAKHGFDWSGSANRESVATENANSWRSSWKRYASRMEGVLPPNEVESFKRSIENAKTPRDFAETGVTVTRDQALRILGRRDLDWDFDQIFRKKGNVDIGNLILIDSGISFSAENYLNRTTGRQGALNAQRRRMYDKALPENRRGTSREFPTRESRARAERVHEARQQRANEERTSAARTNGLDAAQQSRVDNIIRHWTPVRGQRRNITITAARLRRMMFLSPEQKRYFAATAPLTPEGRRRVLASIEG